MMSYVALLALFIRSLRVHSFSTWINIPNLCESLLLSSIKKSLSSLTTLEMAAVDFITGYITSYVDGMVRPYVAQGAAAVGDVAGGVLFSVCINLPDENVY